MSRNVVIAAAVMAVVATAASAATLGETLTIEVSKARDVQAAAHAAAPAAQLAVEVVVQSVLSQSGATSDDALAAINATRTSLGCIEISAPAAAHPVSCPIWTNAALRKVADQIGALAKGPSATGGANGPATIPPPPAYGAGGGGGGASYRPG